MTVTHKIHNNGVLITAQLYTKLKVFFVNVCLLIIFIIVLLMTIQE